MLRDSRKASYDYDAVQLDYDMHSFCLLDIKFGMDAMVFSPISIFKRGWF